MAAFRVVLRMVLPVLVGLLLGACDPTHLLPPDARLPDGSTYTGGFQEGLFHGEGVQQFASGLVYRGEFREGYWHGDGELESPAGWRYEGEFAQGLMAGQGVWEDDESRYEGAFRDDDFHGHGRFVVNSSVYEAEFEKGVPVKGKHITEYGTYEGPFLDWYYHGEGTFTYPEDGEDAQTVSGTWERGELLNAQEAELPELPVLRTETILVEDRQRLTSQIANLDAQRPGVADVYFLAVGGDGTESVFLRDIQVARTGVQAQFDIENRAIMLLNHRDYETYPLATRPSIEAALGALDATMDSQEDLLFIHLVTHGGQDGELLLQQPGIELPNLMPEDFAQMLEPLSARRKVLVVSACYSGQWLEQLKDPNTLILTSSRDDRTSFGCGDDSEMTWFTKALYQGAGLDLANPDAMYEQTNQQVRVWEEEIGMEEEHWSYPQYHLGENLRLWLEQSMPGTGR
ncbi:MAG: caspase family protein [Pseudomonas sp.]|nr:caspase family protein [Pseudomonas sp.]